MNIRHDRFAFTRMGLIGIAACLALVGAQGAAHARSEAWVVDDEDNDGCDSGESSFDVFFVYPDGGSFFQNTLVYIGTDVYMDEVISVIDPQSDDSSWTLFDGNDRGLQTQTFPLPIATPYRMTNEITNTDGEMLWESTIVVDECDDADITFNQHGPAYEQLANQGFEIPGSSGDRAKKWSGDTAGLSKRVCVADNPNAIRGQCSLRWKAKNDTTSSLKQSVSADMAEVGDAIRLSAWASAEALVGGGKLKATVRLKNGTKQKISIDIPEGDYGFQWLADDIVVSGPVTGVDVSVASKKGSGRFYVDDLMLTVIGNGVPLP